jgi:hypothetical protein
MKKLLIILLSLFFLTSCWWNTIDKDEEESIINMRYDSLEAPIEDLIPAEGPNV